MIRELIELIFKQFPQYGIAIKHAGEGINTGDLDHLGGFEKYDNTKLSEAYVEASHSIVLCKESVVQGGVLFVPRTGNEKLFRTAQLTETDIYYPHDAIEMNGLWMTPEVPALVRLGFWAHVCAYLTEKKNSTVYFSYDIKKDGLDKFYRSLPSKTIYEGPVSMIEGMTYECVERICCFSAGDLASMADELLLQKLFKLIRE